MSNMQVVKALKRALADEPGRYALHSGYGLVRLTEKVGRESWWGDTIGVTPIASDLLEVFQGEEGWKGDGTVDDDVSLAWTEEAPKMDVDFSVRYVHQSELVPLDTLDAEVVRRILSGSRFLSYWDVFGEDEDVEPCKAANLSDILEGVYPVGIDAGGRVTTVSRRAKLYKLDPEKWGDPIPSSHEVRMAGMAKAAERNEKQIACLATNQLGLVSAESWITFQRAIQWLAGWNYAIGTLDHPAAGSLAAEVAEESGGRVIHHGSMKDMLSEAALVLVLPPDTGVKRTAPIVKQARQMGKLVYDMTVRGDRQVMRRRMKAYPVPVKK